jgi:site-specific recombinase XerD
MEIETIKEKLKYYLEELEDLERTKTTIKNYSTNINMYINFLIANDIKDLNQDNINDTLERYRSYLKNDRNNKTSTRIRYLQEIILFLERLGFKISIKLPKNQNQHKDPKYLTIEEIQEVMKTIPNSMVRDKAVFQTLYRTGLRVSELANLTKQDIDLNSNEKVIAINVENGKGNKQRTVFIDQDTLELLNQMINKRAKTKKNKAKENKNDYLFIGRTWNKLQDRDIQNIIKKYAIATDERLAKENKKTNYKEILTPHTLRHSFTIYLLNNAKRPINEVQKLLGHSNLATTSIYADVGNKEIKKGYESIEWDK